MGARRPKDSFPLPLDLAGSHPALIELADVRKFGTDWLRACRFYLSDVYQDNPLSILRAAQKSSRNAGDDKAEADLATYRRDFACWLLVQQAENSVDFLLQGRYLYTEALQVVHDPAFTLALAQAGADIRTTRIGEQQDTVLMRFLEQAYNPAQVDVLLQTVPAMVRQAYVNTPNKLGMTALHFLAHVPEAESSPIYVQGTASTLAEHGAKMDYAVKFDYGTGPTWGNIAHLAVASGQVELTAELLAIDRNLFAAHPDGRIEQTPYELGCELVEHKQLKAAAGRAWALVAEAVITSVSQGSLRVVAVAPHGSPLENTLQRDLKATTNLAAFAIDKPLPYGDARSVVERLGPATAPQARFILH